MARLLDVPVLLTEQYPQGLGPTVPELGAQGIQPVSKTCFSMVPSLQKELDRRSQLQSVLLCGIETQACILVRPCLTPGFPILTSCPGALAELPSTLIRSTQLRLGLPSSSLGALLVLWVWT